MKTTARQLIFILALSLITPSASWAAPADPPTGNDNNAGDQTAPATPPVVTEVLERTDKGAEAGDEAGPRDLILVGKDAIVRQGETCSQVVVVGGSATIDGTVTGDVVVIAGSAKVTGKINGELVVVLGSADLGPEARVKHDAVVVGGPLSTAPGAKIDGDRREIAIGTGLSHFMSHLNPMNGWLGKGLFHARLLPPARGWWWGMALLFLVFYVLVALLFQRPVQACVRALETRPVASIFSGILAFLLVGPVMLLLAVSGVGLVIVPFAICAIFVAALLGKVTVYQCVGLQFGRQTGLAALQQPLLALVLGTVLFYLLYTIPVLSLIIWGLIAPLGTGAVLIAFFSAFRKERKPNETTTPTNPVAAIPAAAFAAPASGPPPVTNLAAAGIPMAGAETGVPPVLPTSPADPTAPPPPWVSTPPSVTPPPVVAGTVLLPRVGFWLRLWAVILDALLIGGITMVLHLHGLFLLLWIIYHIGMWTWRGTTIGGVVIGIKIFRRDGQPLNFGVALVRSLASFFSAIVLGLGFFWAGWDREKQSWHDKIAGTIVVRMPKGMSLL